jgi:hypothetical protein
VSVPVFTCRQFTASLGDYLDEALQVPVREELDRHVRECSRCRVIWETTRKTVELYKNAPICPVPVEVELRLMAAIQMKSWPRE